MTVLKIWNTDVLVLGAGLAGMRAALAAQTAGPGLNITVVSQRFGPSGSSFANINDKLGMQVCLTDLEREAFTREAISIAAPGDIDPLLVQILAEESAARFCDVEAIGFPFDRDARGEFVRATGCFSLGEKRAFVFSGLAVAYEALRNKFLSLGGRFIEGWLVQDLLKNNEGVPPGVCGAVLQKAKGDEKIAVNAKSVIMAMGGPAALFAQNVAGLGTHGIAHALLKRAGVELVNTRYVQFLWHTVDTRQFRPIQSCLKEGALIRNCQGKEAPVPEELFGFARERSIHCPVAYGLKDFAVDRFFIENLNSSGMIDVHEPLNGWETITLMAHAGNGGAKINADAWTGVNGLFACGESAGGMHGANRIGGAMVTGTQVFGARAGKAAAIYAANAVTISEQEFLQKASQITRTQTENEDERREMTPWLRNGMQEFAIVGGRPGLRNFIIQVREQLLSVRDWRTRLAFESAVIIGSNATEEGHVN